MANCKDCINYGACKVAELNASNEVENWCDLFKDSALFVKLPYKNGDEFYIIDNVKTDSGWKPFVRKRIVAYCEVSTLNDYVSIQIMCTAGYIIPESLTYLSKEEAEQALRKREENEVR